MIRYKPGVKLQGARPEIIAAIAVVDGIMSRHGVDTVITSVVDGKHSAKSKHYIGCAFDCRSKELHIGKHQVLTELCNTLTNEFTVILEVEGEANEHFHIQFGHKGKVLEWLNPKQLEELS